MADQPKSNPRVQAHPPTTTHAPSAQCYPLINPAPAPPPASQTHWQPPTDAAPAGHGGGPQHRPTHLTLTLSQTYCQPRTEAAPNPMSEEGYNAAPPAQRGEGPQQGQGYSATHSPSVVQTQAAHCTLAAPTAVPMADQPKSTPHVQANPHAPSRLITPVPAPPPIVSQTYWHSCSPAAPAQAPAQATSTSQEGHNAAPQAQRGGGPQQASLYLHSQSDSQATSYQPLVVSLSPYLQPNQPNEQHRT